MRVFIEKWEIYTLAMQDTIHISTVTTCHIGKIFYRDALFLQHLPDKISYMNCRSSQCDSTSLTVPAQTWWHKKTWNPPYILTEGPEKTRINRYNDNVPRHSGETIACFLFILKNFSGFSVKKNKRNASYISSKKLTSLWHCKNTIKKIKSNKK